MFSVASSQAQTADEIINKYFEALGGKDKVASMKTLHTEYDVDMNGAAASGANWVVNGKGFKNEMNLMGQQMIQCYTDTSGWMINPFGGSTAPTPMPAEMVKAGQGQLDIAGPFFNYAAKGSTIELLGKETVDGKSAFKFKIKSRTGPEITSWIDATTYYLLKNYIKTPVNGMEMETTMSFSNYKKTDNGYMIPWKVELTVSPAITVNMTITKAEVNKEIDSKVFEMPKQ
jgi:outer membrane lipoprotein-sorting protein